MLQRRLVSKSRVRTSQLLRHTRMGGGESANMNLVEDRVGERMLRFGHRTGRRGGGHHTARDVVY